MRSLNTMSRKQNMFLLSTVLLFWFLVGCKTLTTTESPIRTPFVVTEQLIPTSFADLVLSPACITPCWLGIQVGRTNFKEVENTLVLRYGAENVTIIDKNHISWKAPSVDGLSAGNIFLTDNVVSEILLFPDLTVGLNVDKLFESLGKPTWVQVFQDPNNSCLGISLIYSSSGTYVKLDLLDNLKGVRPTQNILVLRFLDPRLTEHWNAYDSILLEWDGYKDYCPE